MTEDEIVRWNNQHNGCEFEQPLGVGDVQGSLVCYSPWGCKKSDMTELSEQQLQKLNNNDNKRNYI